MERRKNMGLKNGWTRVFIILILCLGLLGCSEDGEDSSKLPIIGGWKANTECLETYAYNSDNTFTLRSHLRLLTGTYSFAGDATTDGRYKLTLNISSDNTDTDCNHASTAGEGPISEFFISFTNKNQTHTLYSVNGEVILSADRADLSVCDCGI